jgi:hypothetical protein
MIMRIPQLISCGIHMKSEIPLDRAAPGARVPRVSRRALTVATRHFSERHCLASASRRHEIRPVYH